MLAAPGNVLPAYDANLCNLPWNVCWQSPEAEILEQLLNGELHALPVEIHHCRTQEFKNLLKQKMNMVEDMAGRVKNLH